MKKSDGRRRSNAQGPEKYKGFHRLQLFSRVGNAPFWGGVRRGSGPGTPEGAL